MSTQFLDGELGLCEVFLVAAQELADGVDRIALAGAAAVVFPGETASQVGEVVLGELHDMDSRRRRR